MEIYRSPMEKILKQMENDTIITNPKEPARTFFRKIAYRFAYGIDRLRHLYKRHQDHNKQK